MYTNTRIIRSRRALWILLFAWPLLALLGPVIGRWLNVPSFTPIIMTLWLLALPVWLPRLIEEAAA
jgi:hypothetical protein